MKPLSRIVLWISSLVAAFWNFFLLQCLFELALIVGERIYWMLRHPKAHISFFEGMSSSRQDESFVLILLLLLYPLLLLLGVALLNPAALQTRLGKIGTALNFIELFGFFLLLLLILAV